MRHIRGYGLIAVLTAVILLTAAPASALEKVGTTSMQVLKTPMGVRGIALGNAMAAHVTGVEAVWWNPGALVETSMNEVNITQINMPADIQLNGLAYGMPWGDYSAVSLHVINLFTDDMPVRTWDMPRGTGENFNAYDFVVGAGYARRLTDRFSLGANVRYLRSGLEDVTYDGVSVDLGTLYKTGLRSMRLGMAIQNLGPDVKYSGTYLDHRNAFRTESGDPEEVEYEGASLPTVFRLGISFDVFEMFKLEPGEEHDGSIAFEMNHPNDNQERLNIGGEYAFKQTLFLRIGGKFGYDEETVAGGFGLRFNVIGDYRVGFDYAYSHWGRITEAGEGFADSPHRFSLGFEW